MSITLEIIGPEPPCRRCKETYENAKKAAEKLESEGFDVDVSKLNSVDRDTIKRFGVVRTPALAVNGVLRIAGKVLDHGVIMRIVKREET